MSTLASEADEDMCFWLLVSDPAAANWRAATQLQQEFRDLPLPCAAGPAKKLIQCRNHKIRSVIFVPPLGSNSLCQPRTRSLSVAMAAPGAAELVLLGLHCGAPSLSAWLHCLSCCQLLGPMPAEGTVHLQLPWPHPFLAA